MKRRAGKWLLLVVCLSLTISQGAIAREQSDKTSKTIDDIAKLGVLAIDKSMNLVGIGWEDRIVKEIVPIGSKYYVTLTNYQGRILVDTKQGGGNLLGGIPIVYVELPDEWTEIASFPDLPMFRE